MDGTQFDLFSADIDDSLPAMIVDSFAGGGGASTGILRALGRSPDIAINHDETALGMHAANHPETIHLTESIWEVNPRDVIPPGRRVGLLWASPDCTHHSLRRLTFVLSRRIVLLLSEKGWAGICTPIDRRRPKTAPILRGFSMVRRSEPRKRAVPSSGSANFVRLATRDLHLRRSVWLTDRRMLPMSANDSSCKTECPENIREQLHSIRMLAEATEILVGNFRKITIDVSEMSVIPHLTHLISEAAYKIEKLLDDMEASQ